MRSAGPRSIRLEVYDPYIIIHAVIEAPVSREGQPFTVRRNGRLEGIVGVCNWCCIGSIGGGPNQAAAARKDQRLPVWRPGRRVALSEVAEPGAIRADG